MTATAGFTAPAPEDLTSQGRGWRREVLLSGVRAEQRTIEAAEARKLSLVTEWADLISAADRGGPPAAYRWDSPLGHAYLVTYPLD
ncbi:hypothetical protein [Nocardioides marmoribigeumensis]|uniref:Uncharacterized protein n=1 Tax=Nocardioides marmoribigeumensis TaxID=433649 RepID=A0ABU2BSD8_9ACTN|nr:hypothetical protein [Nocardioides marmoribigeumensis]MDR7360899.1 hypothetical protein [Nocardioides marmoribigeumensis]